MGTRTSVVFAALCAVFGGCQGTAHVSIGASSPPALSSSSSASPHRATPPLSLDALPSRELTHARILEPDKRDPCTWVESWDSEKGYEQDSLTFLNHRALAKARERAMGVFLGIRVTSYDVMRETTLQGRTAQTYDSYLRETRKGLILHEKVRYSHSGRGHCDGCPFTRVVVEDCLKKTPERRFVVTLSLDRTQYRNGDGMTITIRTVPEKHIYLYDENLDTRTLTLIAPNEYVPDFPSRKGKRRYPTRALSSQGAVLVAELPTGQKKVSYEGILALVTPTQLPGGFLQPRKGETEGDLLNRLDRNQISWERVFRPFSIIKPQSKSSVIETEGGP